VDDKLDHNGPGLIISRRTLFKLTALSLLPVLMDVSRGLVLGLEALEGLSDEQREAITKELRAIAKRLRELADLIQTDASGRFAQGSEASEASSDEHYKAVAKELRAIAKRLRKLADLILEADGGAG
jgi:ribosome recycling factor